MSLLTTANPPAAARAVAERVRDRLREEQADPLRHPEQAARVALAEVRRHNDFALARGLEVVDDEAACVRDVLAQVTGYGALQTLLDDPDVEEIWINDPTTVFVARAGRSERVPLRLTDDAVRDLVERMLHATGRRVDLSQPFVDASLPDGSRLHVVIPDITRSHYAVNIRKFLAATRTLDDLVAARSLGEPVADLLRAAMADGRNVLVSGPTHAGKTTLLAALIAACPSDQRIVTVEETFELAVAALDIVALQGRQASLEGTGAVTLRRLVKEALRMRPDRLVVGEVRDAEALDLLLALNTGVPGAATIHANSADDALRRLATLPLLAGRNIDAEFVVPAIATGVDLVVHCRRRADGHRFVEEIVETTGRTLDGVVETRRVHRAGSAIVLWGAVLGAGLLLSVSPWLWPARQPGEPSAASSVDEPPRTADSRVARLLQEAGFAHAPAGRPLLIGAVLAALCAALALVATSLPAVTLVAAVAGGAAPFSWLHARARRLRRARRGLWSDVCDLLISAARAGVSLPDAVSALALNGPPPLRGAFARFAVDMAASGHFDSSALRLKAALADPVADRIVETLRMARHVGGTELTSVLRALSASVRADAALRAEVEARQSWVRGAAVVGVVAPWVVLGLLTIRPEGAAAYASAAGVVVVVVGAVISVLAYRLTLRVGRLPEPQRWFG